MINIFILWQDLWQKGGFIMNMNRKTKIYVLVLIWAAILLQLFINSSIDREKRMVEQVMSEDISNLTEGTVKAYAYFGDETLNETVREGMAQKLAKELGITSGYRIENKVDDKAKSEITTLSKHGEQADTLIKIISLHAKDRYEQESVEDYVMVEINLKGSNGTAAYTYKKKLADIYEALGMNANTNIYLLSQEKGQLLDEEIDDYINRFLEETNASEIDRTEFDNVICIYGYSKDIDEFVYLNNKRVNVNIAFSYDSNEDITYIHRAVPFVDKSF